MSTIDDEAPEIDLDEAATEGVAEEVDVDQSEGDDGDEELTIEIDGIGDDDAEPATPTIRKRDRELAEIRKAGPVAKVEVGDEPTLEGCEWDDEKFKADWRGWNDRKAQADRQEADQSRAQEAAQAHWNTALSTYRGSAAKLGVADYDEAEAIVGGALPLPVGNAVIQYFGDAAPKLVLALHKHPKLLEKVAATAEQDPIRAILELWDISKGIKVTNKRRAMQPEEVLSGSAPVSNVPADKKLAALEKEAERTGDRTKLIAYRKSLKKAA